MSDLFNQLVDITKAHVKNLKLEVEMPDMKYICLSCSATFGDGWLNECHKCHVLSCPDCGGEVATIEEYDKAMKEMYNDD